MSKHRNQFLHGLDKFHASPTLVRFPSTRERVLGTHVLLNSHHATIFAELMAEGEVVSHETPSDLLGVLRAMNTPAPTRFYLRSGQDPSLVLTTLRASKSFEKWKRRGAKK